MIRIASTTLRIAFSMQLSSVSEDSQASASASWTNKRKISTTRERSSFAASACPSSYASSAEARSPSRATRVRMSLMQQNIGPFSNVLMEVGITCTTTWFTSPFDEACTTTSIGFSTPAMTISATTSVLPLMTSGNSLSTGLSRPGITTAACSSFGHSSRSAIPSQSLSKPSQMPSQSSSKPLHTTGSPSFRSLLHRICRLSTTISFSPPFMIGTENPQSPSHCRTSRLIWPRSSLVAVLPAAAFQSVILASRHVCARLRNTCVKDRVTSPPPSTSTTCVPISCQPKNDAPQSLNERVTATSRALLVPSFCTVTVTVVAWPAIGELGLATMAPYP
mmetsp:Transcript_27225/g.55572  ORF Transcript_27225/g.55572 Transcript_27225/m.55572 type:complete len:335 (+) Transcript_27225:253-1257(+)